MEFELKVNTTEGAEVLYTFSDFAGDDLEFVAESMKRFLYIAGYDITLFEDE